MLRKEDDVGKTSKRSRILVILVLFPPPLVASVIQPGFEIEKNVRAKLTEKKEEEEQMTSGSFSTIFSKMNISSSLE